MAKVSLAKLAQAAAEADDPGFASPSIPKPGGVDPLGLRQINFDLMDMVFPGLNNVARYLRPFEYEERRVKSNARQSKTAI
jgi:hypothetical protein